MANIEPGKWISDMPDELWKDRMKAISELGIHGEGAWQESRRLDQLAKKVELEYQAHFATIHEYATLIETPSKPKGYVEKQGSSLMHHIFEVAQTTPAKIARVIVLTSRNNQSYITAYSSRFDDVIETYPLASTAAEDAITTIELSYANPPTILLIEDLYHIHKKWTGAQGDLMRRLEHSTAIGLRVLAASPTNPGTGIFNCFDW